MKAELPMIEVLLIVSALHRVSLECEYEDRGGCRQVAEKFWPGLFDWFQAEEEKRQSQIAEVLAKFKRRRKQSGDLPPLPDREQN